MTRHLVTFIVNTDQRISEVVVVVVVVVEAIQMKLAKTLRGTYILQKPKMQENFGKSVSRTG